MVAYISGPITGAEGYKERFEAAEKALRATGFEVINPARIENRENWTWEDYMLECLPMMRDADVVVLLPGWMDSKGSQIERLYGIGAGKVVCTIAEATKGEA